MSDLLKEATLTGRLASLARHPLNVKKRSKLDRKISEQLVSSINVPIFKTLTEKKIPGTKRTAADVAGGVGGWAGIMGKPGRVGSVKKKFIGRAVARYAADNPELAVAQAMPVPYLASGMALGKKRLYQLLGAKTPAEVRRAMERRRALKTIGVGAGVTGAALAGQKVLDKKKDGETKEAMILGLCDELEKIARDERATRRAHKPSPVKKIHKGQRLPNVHKAWKYSRPTQR
jgi:hypothetical protein